VLFCRYLRRGTLLFHHYQKNDDAVQSAFARILIDAGADSDLVDKSGESLLLLSLRQGRPEIARLLVKAGASVLGEIHEKYFIMFAARNGMNDLIDETIDIGLDVNR
jgi:ankyrin repeat protein